jgi:NAD(P)-dependent dehydrogenase (short-subunit alcohol dehydrogenase family)
VGRDPERTDRARSEISEAAGAPVEADLADLSSLAETAALAARFATRHDRLDVLVLNAGALTHEYTVTGEGNETTLATHVLSPFLLIRALRPLLQASAPSRVILVSSGGMYTEPLDVAALDPEPVGYDGTKAYARCKRAQVVLAEEWTRDLLDTGIAVNAMHPGWADTPGLRAALPGFSRIVGSLLRTPEQGADTIVWLAAAPDATDLSGMFFLDRRPRAKHRLRRTRRPDEAREAARLWRLCTERTAPFTAATGGSAV